MCACSLVVTVHRNEQVLESTQHPFIMPPKHPAKKSKREFDVKVLDRLLVGYDKDNLLDVVDKVCRMSMTQPSELEAVAKALLLQAYHVDMYDRKPLAVLARRLHDRMPRCAPQLSGLTSVAGRQRTNYIVPERILICPDLHCSTCHSSAEVSRRLGNSCLADKGRRR